MEGLTGEEARRRLTQYGKNILPEKREFTAAGILMHQFTPLQKATGVNPWMNGFENAKRIAPMPRA